MTTRNIVPRATGEGSIGTLLKRWGGAFFNGVDVKSGNTAPINTLQRETAYNVNDIVYTSELNARYYLLCVTAGTTASTLPSFSGATSDTQITDGTVVWRVQTVTSQEKADAKFLPLSGGTMTGNIILHNNTTVARRDVANSWTVLLGGTTDSDGAYLRLDGMTSNSAGSFMLKASDGTNSRLLVGRPDGTLEWDGKNIERVRAGGTYYIRFDSGLQIVWGYTTATSEGKKVTFPVAFANTTYAVVPQTTGANLSAGYSFKTTTSVVFESNHATAQAGIDYICIGRWK